jgi:hypothetical protein
MREDMQGGYVFITAGAAEVCEPCKAGGDQLRQSRCRRTSGKSINRREKEENQDLVFGRIPDPGPLLRRGKCTEIGFSIAIRFGNQNQDPVLIKKSLIDFTCKTPYQRYHYHSRKIPAPAQETVEQHNPRGVRAGKCR